MLGALGLLLFAQAGEATSLPRPCPTGAPSVCGMKGGAAHDYPNLCAATRDGARRIVPGTCRPRQAERPTVCTMIYAPVCAVKNGRFKTYPNACMARGAGASVRQDFACGEK